MAAREDEEERAIPNRDATVTHRNLLEFGARAAQIKSVTHMPSFEPGPIARRNAAELSAAAFRAEFSRPCGGMRRPVLIAGLLDGWAASKRWQLDVLRDERGARVVTVEDRVAEEEAMLPLRDVVDRVKRGDTSIYVFEANVDAHLPTLAEDYAVPHGYFEDDVLHLLELVDNVSESDSDGPAAAGAHSFAFSLPDSTWFLLGARGSGSEVHQDPPHMSSWNACVIGAKRWAFVDPAHPGLDAATITGTGESADAPRATLSAAEWFAAVLPVLERAHPSAVRTLVQRAGEVVYFPPHVWHCVLNVEDAVAVTGSYIARRDFDGALDRARCAAAAKRAAAPQPPASGGLPARAAAAAAEAAGIAAAMDAEFGIECVDATAAWIARVVRG